MVPVGGRALVSGSGCDTDEMLRWVEVEFNPAWEDEKTKVVRYTALASDDLLPIPMSDKMEHDFLVRYLRRIGYTLEE